MSRTMKIWERMIERKMQQETRIGEEKFSFTSGRGHAIDAIFALRWLIEKHREMQAEPHMVFIDLEKAYDQVTGKEIWKCMSKIKVSEKYVQIIIEMYKCVESKVRTRVCSTEGFFLNSCRVSRGIDFEFVLFGSSHGCAGGKYKDERVMEHVICRQHCSLQADRRATLTDPGGVEWGT